MVKKSIFNFSYWLKTMYLALYTINFKNPMAFPASK